QDAALAYCEQSLQDHPQSPLPIPLAVLAAQADRIGNWPETKTQLEQNVWVQLPQAARPDAAVNLLDASCAARPAEMRAAAKPSPLLQGTVLACDTPRTWPQQIADMNLASGQSAAALIDMGSQWMLALFVKPAEDGKMQCVLFDPAEKSEADRQW